MSLRERRIDFEDIAEIDRQRYIVHFQDGTREQCFPLSQRYAKICIIASHRCIKDVHFERIRGQRFFASLFISALAPVCEVISSAKSTEKDWLQDCVEIEYRVLGW